MPSANTSTKVLRNSHSELSAIGVAGLEDVRHDADARCAHIYELVLLDMSVVAGVYATGDVVAACVIASAR